MNTTSQHLVDSLHQLANDPRDQPAWDHLATQCGPAMLQLARAILGEDASADDAVQDAFLYLRDHAGVFRGNTDSSAQAWIRQITRTAALQMLRTRKIARRHALAVARHQLALQQANNADDAHDPELLDHVRRVLSELSHDQQQSVVMRLIEGRDYGDLARELDCSISTARSHVHRGLKKMRKILALSGLPLALSTISNHLAAAMPASEITQPFGASQVGAFEGQASPDLIKMMNSHEASWFSSAFGMNTLIVASIVLGCVAFQVTRDNEQAASHAEQHAVTLQSQQPAMNSEAAPPNAIIEMAKPHDPSTEQPPGPAIADPVHPVQIPANLKPSMRFRDVDKKVDIFEHAGEHLVRITPSGQAEAQYQGPLDEQSMAAQLGQEAAERILQHHQMIQSVISAGGRPEDMAQRAQEALDRMMRQAATQQHTQEPTTEQPNF